MNSELLRTLSVITEEEQSILDGHQVDIGRYGADKRKVLDAHTLLGSHARIDVRPHTRFAHFPRHRHDFVEIMYVCTGTVTHIIGGAPVVVRQGELLFLGRNSWHEILPVSKDTIGINFIIRPTFFHTAFDMMDSENPISDFILNCLAQEGSADEYLHFKVAAVLPVQNLVENLVYSLCNHDEVGRTNELTMGLLLRSLIKYSQSAEIHGDQSRALALQLFQYIDSNYADATLQQFAAIHHLPVYTASRLLKNHFSTTFRHLLMERRFAAATNLLRTSPLTITEIISAVGYENTSYFYRSFSQRHNCTPQQYREKFLKTP